jgi:hypothetical protein
MNDVEFKFYLKHNNKKSIGTLYWLLFFLHLVAALLSLKHAIDKTEIIKWALFVCSYIVFSVLFFGFKKIKNRFLPVNILLFFIYVVFWIMQGNFIAAILVFGVLFFLDFIKKKLNTILFTASQIELSSALLKKQFTWQQINNVILKDDVLTIDLISNKILQEEVIENKLIQVDEFNDFCKKQITHL